jgi:hypothetical protein
MRPILLAISTLFLCAPPSLFAQTTQSIDRQAQIQAASDAAVDNLLQEILEQHVGLGVTVQEVIDRTGAGTDSLRAILRQGKQIGGPRWLDEQTCQVRLEVSASAVAAEVVRIAGEHAATTPIDLASLKDHLRSWQRRTFSTTGASAARVDDVRPPPSAVSWAAVPDDARRRAIADARNDAVQKILQSIGGVDLAEHKTFDDALKIPGIERDMATWLSQRPVTKVEFLDDRQVRLTLAAAPADFVEQFRAVTNRLKNLPLPRGDKEWRRVCDDLARSMAPPVGQAAAEPAVTASASFVLPRQPPDWVDRQLTADGSAPAASSKLMSAHAAAAAALDKIFQQIRALPLAGDESQTRTLGQIADQDPTFASRLLQAVEQSKRITGAEYLPDGSAVVHESLELRAFWEQLSSN